MKRRTTTIFLAVLAVQPGVRVDGAGGWSVCELSKPVESEAKHALEMSAAQQRHDELLSVMAEERREAKEQQNSHLVVAGAGDLMEREGESLSDSESGEEDESGVDSEGV